MNMKKSLSFAAISAVAISAVAVTPVGTADAAANEAGVGYYDTVANKYYTIKEFSKLPTNEKRDLFLSDGLYLHTGDFVISGKDVILTPDAELDSKLIPVDEFDAADLNKIYNGSQGEDPVEAELTVESVSAINAKTLEVTFNRAVEDTSKANFEVRKGSVKVNTSKLTWNEEKTAVAIELTGKLTAGEYTVNVTGLAEETLTGKVTAEDEKVSKITLVDDKALITNDTENQKTVTIGYKVENQYGEDITDTTPINSVTAAGTSVKSSLAASATKGLVTIPVKNDVKVDDSIVLTLVHTATGTSVSETIKVAAKSALADVEVKGIYNKDGKTLDETTVLTKDAFYLLIEGIDQYGNVLKPEDVKGLISNNTNPLIVGLNGGTNPTVETIKVDGKDVAAIRLVGSVNAGETTVMLISPNTGKNATQKITVAEAQRTDQVTLEVPELVVAGEELFVPITVTDKEGNEVTDINVIKDPTRGIKVSGLDNTIDTKDGKIGIKVTSGDLGAVGYKSLVAISSTNKSTVANFEVKAAAEATIVTGLKDASKALLPNGTTTISTETLQVEDQYGRVMTKDALEAWLKANGANKIVVEDDSDSNVINLSGSEIKNNGGTINSLTITGNNKGTEKISITLVNAEGEITTSTKDFTIRVTDGTEYVSYEVEEIGTILDEKGAELENDEKYDKEIVVYGVLEDGSKVKLTHTTDFTVDAPDYLVYDNGKLTKTDDKDVPYANEDDTELTTKVTVTINATGEQFTKNVTVSKVAPKVVDFKVVANGTATTAAASKKAYDDAEEVTEVDALDFTSTTVAGNLVDFVAVDSYGAIHAMADGTSSLVSSIKLLATPAVANTITFGNQNSAGLTFAGLEKGETFTVKATVDGVEKTFKVVGEYDTEGQLDAAKDAVEQATLAVTTAAASKAQAISDLETAVKELTFTHAGTGVSNKKISEVGISVEILVDEYTEADTDADEDGEIKFRVKLSKGNNSVTTSQLTAEIPAE